MDQRMTAAGIVWDDTWHRIEIQGYSLNLSPTQYRVLRVFADSIPSTLVSSDEVIALAYRSRHTLLTKAELSPISLFRHISDLNARIRPHGLHLQFFQDGYILLLSRQKNL